MRKPKLVPAILMMMTFSLIATVRAEDASPSDKFLGSPLLILLAMIVIVAVASLYHKMKK